LHLRAKTHDALDAGAVVPAAIKDDDFTGCRQMRYIPLQVHLAPFAFGGRRQRDDAKDPGAHPLGDGLDRASLAGPITSLEDDAYLGPGLNHPFLQLDQFDVQGRQFPFIFLRRHSPARLALVLVSGAFRRHRIVSSRPSGSTRRPEVKGK
jgi:hypothetical protein